MHGMKIGHGARRSGHGPFGGSEGRGFGGRNHEGRGLGEGRGSGMFGGRGGGGRPDGAVGRRGKRFAGEELRLMVLALLENEPQHGYQLIRSFAVASGEAYSPSPGMLYPLLTLLADMGLVEEVVGEGAGSRRSFALTDGGKAEVETNRGKLAELMGKLASLAEVAGRTDAGPVRRAMMNLRTAAVQRLSRDGASDELAFELAAILDEAAQKIERLK